METASSNLGQLAASSKRLAHRLLALGENRLELLVLELQEERERFLQATALALAAAVFGLLAGIGFTITVVVACWHYSPVLAMVVLSLIYGAIAAVLYMRFVRLRRNWDTLPGTLKQLKKDRECMENCLD